MGSETWAVVCANSNKHSSGHSEREALLVAGALNEADSASCSCGPHIAVEVFSKAPPRKEDYSDDVVERLDKVIFLLECIVEHVRRIE